MKIAIVSGNPKKDGLCASMVEAAKEGALSGGATVDEIRLCDMKLIACKVCGDGWGTCRKDNHCAFGSDGFDDAKARVEAADAVVFVTPVYWWEMSEALKNFLDRLRRCEFGNGILSGKQALLVASAGGTGNGVLNCLEQLDRFCRHTNAAIFDAIAVNRWNSDYVREAIKAATAAIANGRKNGDTV